MTLEQLQTERDKLLATLAKPAEVSSPEDGTITFRQTADIDAALQRIDAEIAKLTGTDARVFVIQTSRGI